MAKDSLAVRARRLVNSNATVGASILAFARDGMAHAMQHGDSTGLAIMVGGLDATDSSRFRGILGACFMTGHVKIVKDAKQASGFLIKPGVGRKWADVEVNGNKIGVLNALIDDKVSFRSKRVQSDLFDEKAETVWDAEKVAVRVLKDVDKHGMTPAEFLAVLVKAARLAGAKV